MGAGTRVKVTEKNALQLLGDNVLWKYGEDGVWNLEDQCTYNLDFDDENKVYKQIFIWLMFERKDLQTGKTSVEEFVEKFVNNNSDSAKKILGMRNIITDTFLILKNKDNILIVEGLSEKKFMGTHFKNILSCMPLEDWWKGESIDGETCTSSLAY